MRKEVKCQPLRNQKHQGRKGRADALPIRILCKRCGKILCEGKELKPPYEVLEQYEGRCPECGRKLSYEPIDVRIKRIK